MSAEIQIRLFGAADAGAAARRTGVRTLTTEASFLARKMFARQGWTTDANRPWFAMVPR